MSLGFTIRDVRSLLTRSLSMKCAWVPAPTQPHFVPPPTEMLRSRTSHLTEEQKSTDLTMSCHRVESRHLTIRARMEICQWTICGYREFICSRTDCISITASTPRDWTRRQSFLIWN